MHGTKLTVWAKSQEKHACLQPPLRQIGGTAPQKNFKRNMINLNLIMKKRTYMRLVQIEVFVVHNDTCCTEIVKVARISKTHA